jgi:V/A-type H+-transporting ATPase subunit I
LADSPPGARGLTFLPHLEGERTPNAPSGAGLFAGLRAEHGPRLAALEARLAREVEKTQAPLQFAVTESTFHLEGWVPRSRANRVRNAIAARLGDKVYVEDLGDAPRHDASSSHHHGRGEHAQEHDQHALARDERAVALAGASTAGARREAPAAPPAGAEGAARHGDPGGADAGSGGHHATEAKDEPPIHLENKGLAKPYEFLLGLLGKPRYQEIDPTKLMLVFFPLFFGLMVGDLVVGLIIMAVGMWLRSNKVFGIGGPAVGRVLMMGGLMAALVGGVVFGEALGIHFVTPEPHEEGEEKELSWEEVLGVTIPSKGFIHKTGAQAHGASAADSHATSGDSIDARGEARPGTFTTLQGDDEDPCQDEEGHVVPCVEEDAGSGITALLKPHSDTHLSVNGWFNLGYYSKIHDIQALLVWSLLIGFIHIVLGLVLGVRNVYVAHGAKLAIQEKAAWLILIAGAIVAILGAMDGSNLLAAIGVGGAVAAIALLWAGAAHTLGVGFIALLEVPSLAGNLVSYTRLAAIGASKAGMAMALMAVGFDMAGGGAVGWTIYLVGFVGIIALAMLAGGLQSLRLQFVEFFGKFYQGGGRAYVPFGRRAP